jgi:hypothetical protein
MAYGSMVNSRSERIVNNTYKSIKIHVGLLKHNNIVSVDSSMTLTSFWQSIIICTRQPFQLFGMYVYFSTLFIIVIASHMPTLLKLYHLLRMIQMHSYYVYIVPLSSWTVPKTNEKSFSSQCY